MPGFLGGSSGGSGGVSGEIQFPKEFIDPVTKLRVSQPQTLIDTDFEYGLQPTKWETVELINNTPSFFSASGDTTIPNITQMTTTAGSREIKVTTALAHGVAVGIPINVTGTKSLTADGSYIINSIPDSTSFTYLCKQNQLVTASILDLYTSIITGQFFQGSQIRISDSEGIVTNAQGQSTLTLKTDAPHGFGVNTPFYFLNLNSTISQEFDASNTGSKTFDASNTATAQSFDGSNNLTSYAIDLTNSAVSGGAASTIVSTNTSSDTLTVTHGSENFVGKPIGTPLYYNITSSSGYFFTNPRGIIYLNSVSGLGTSSSEFTVSTIPGGSNLDLTTTATGTIRLANAALTFAGNTIDEAGQTVVPVDAGSPRSFDGANNTGSTSTVNSFSNGSSIIQMVNNAGSAVDTGLYVNAMVRYSTTGTAAGGLTNNTTYWLTFYSVVVSAAPGLIQLKVAATPGGSDIVISSQGSGTHTFQQIGVSTDKDIVHIRSHGLVTGDLVKYTYPAGGAVTRAAFVKDYMFVNRVDADNLTLESDIGLQATGGTVSTINVSGVNYKVHRFVVDSNATSKTMTFTVSAGNAVGEFLVVAGGGAGTGYVGGGGGGGGFIEGTMNLTAGTYTVVVGGGSGEGLTAGQRSPNGKNSSITGPNVTITAIGGGSGGHHDSNPGADGGSGGGGGSTNGQTALGGNPNAGSWSGSAIIAAAGYAFRGGNTTGSRVNADCEGAGGGGAGGIGQDHDNKNRSNGGPGRASSISGTQYYYAGGGGGGAYYGNQAGDNLGGGLGGIGGGGGGGTHGDGAVAGTGGTGGESAGGNGSNQGEGPGGQGGQNTGGGGGSTGHNQNNPGGGSGIVYIRYRA
jgi:hypothetical protein